MTPAQRLTSIIAMIFWMLSPIFGSEAKAELIQPDLLGDWALEIESREAGWLRITEDDGQPSVSMMVNVGTIKPLNGVEVKEGKIQVPLKTFRKGGKKGPIVSTNRAEIWSENGQLKGEIITHFPQEDRESRDPFTGISIPPMPPAPDLSKVTFGKPITLFNGKDLTGWRVRRPEKINGWSAVGGELVNSTPKTDFTATGAYSNLMTEGTFEDFKLHIEFSIEKDRNSGIYIRGLYEAQVVDRDSRMQGLQGVGSIFSLIERSENPAYEGGKWQTYEITLVDRHISVVLNGVKTIDNQPVSGPTSGAVHTNPMTPGPIYLQGDHTSVKYRNIILAPVE
tara:strand:- start:1575 stop:2588 length:1014 start_codon:yes stop_codon:yes gene_type:complete